MRRFWMRANRNRAMMATSVTTYPEDTTAHVRKKKSRVARKKVRNCTMRLFLVLLVNVMKIYVNFDLF